MTLIQKIMIILVLLVSLFIAGMGIMSHLNLTYSKEAVTELRRKQIEEAFAANLDRIDAHTTLLERHVLEVAHVAGIYHDQSENGGSKAGLEAALRKNISAFSEAAGIGTWFEPDTFAPGYFGPFAYWDGENNRPALTWQFSDAAYDYPNQDWYRAAMAAFTEQKATDEITYWTPARYNALIDDAVITVAAPIRTGSGRLVGVATIDWRFSRVIDLVSGVSITENSFAFLINEKNQKLSSLSAERTLKSQAILAALDLTLFQLPDEQPPPDASQMLQKSLTIDGRHYKVYYARAGTGMLFGVSVPVDEMYSVIGAMRTVNYRVLGITVVVLLLLAAVILHIVAGIMRLLDTLYTDSTTELPNRLKLLQDLKQRPPASLILVDIDAFKEINDFYGHDCGDYLLRDLGRRLAGFLAEHRGRSRMPAGLYKMPADEFAVVLERRDTEYLQEWLDRLKAFFSQQSFFYQQYEIPLHMTMGAALEERSASRPSSVDVVSTANMALQMAKEQHKPALIYDRSMGIREGYEQNLLWANRVKKALEDDRMQPFFQPIVNNATGRVEKFECLARLMDEDGTAVSPYLFLPVAKKLMVYHEITRTIIGKGVETFKDLPYELSINLSYEDIVDAETTDFIRELVTGNDVGGRLFFEVLESESIDNYDEVNQFILAAKEMGCSVAIDDFGSGYSNFEHLLRFNADLIKIDGSLIRNLDRDRNALILTQGIVGFARRLNLKTAAEYVCNEAVLRKVMEIGIDYSQGFYFSEPVASIDMCPRQFDLPHPVADVNG